jgi:hypothetical protein
LCPSENREKKLGNEIEKRNREKVLGPSENREKVLGPSENRKKVLGNEIAIEKKSREKVCVPSENREKVLGNTVKDVCRRGLN